MVDIHLRSNEVVTRAFIALNLAGYTPIDRRRQELRRCLIRDLSQVQQERVVNEFSAFLTSRFRTIDEYRIAVAPLFLPMNPWKIPKQRVGGWIERIFRNRDVQTWRRKVYDPEVRRMYVQHRSVQKQARNFGARAADFFGAPLRKMHVDIHLNPLDTPGYGSMYLIRGRSTLSVAPLPNGTVSKVTLLHELLHVACDHRERMPFRFPSRLPIHKSYREHPRRMLEDEYAARAAVHILMNNERTLHERRRAIDEDTSYGFSALPSILSSFHSP